ncbi:branched-chain amino acid transport system II carrier protein [Lysinibacillus yapensis]|uniref:Branched-chain amino acid transport system carrier protein n=1 Tax=Ureibacillus yapensis TaxID=2304605 RepID=A0A396SAG1_9BACL|nr:branched-chain amino acid transport system II carrier protein [Lysinibacillus yapensis]
MHQGRKLSFTENMAVGFMLFALFLGAGNVIFPPLLGQMAGEELFWSILGFIITGVGLPLLAVYTLAKSGGDLQQLASKVHPLFAVIFTLIIYLALGPFFGMPRTATASFEIGVIPLISKDFASTIWPLAIYSVLYFGITAVLSLNPSKLVDRIGKIMTPVLLIVIALLGVKSFLTPMSEISEPQGTFSSSAFSESFIQGYLTMDVMGALIIGIFITSILREKGVTDKSLISKSTIFAGIVAATALAFVYILLMYIGATSTGAIGVQENGGAVLALASKLLYGSTGVYILSITIIVACLTTAIGLVSATAQYLTSLLPRISYKSFVLILSIFSTIVSNVGLTKLIAISVPVLVAVYPIAIMLVLLSLVERLFNSARIVFAIALTITGIISMFDGLKAAGISISPIENLLSTLPLYNAGIVWLIPAIIGAIIGYIISLFLTKKVEPLED